MKLTYKIHLINPDKVSAIDGYKKTDREDSYKLAYLYRKKHESIEDRRYITRIDSSSWTLQIIMA